ncbi:MAG: hypothetical protein HUJ29_10200 [Gammaproteobacteria bacterium]|nr:hypothetical protein [Gammaproteobacteria bacterium]
MTKPRVLILGYGEMGHAFKALLEGQCDYTLWSRSGTGDSTSRLETARDCDLAIFALPVMAHEAVARQLAEYLPTSSLCLSIAKGLDEAGRPAEAILREFMPTHRHALIYGPMISEEIRAGRPAFAEVGTRDTMTYKAVADLFKGTHLNLQASDDIVGISWAVILKNVYAILFGIADEMALGDNMRGYLMVSALQELSRIVEEKGGKATTPYGLAGLGDLTTTATSENSHHHGLGRCLATGQCDAIEGEGVHTLEMVKKHQLIKLSSYPLFSLAVDILAQPDQTRQLMQTYLDRLKEGD